MKYTRQGISLEYDDIGNGLPLLLIHGFPFDRTSWRPQLAELQTICRVIAPDLRGFGGSSDTDGKSVSMDLYAEDCRALLDSLNVQPVVVGGLSMGGYIALAFVAQYPDRVKGLILANTRATADSEAGRQGRFDTAQKVRESGTQVVVDALASKMLGPNAKPEVAVSVRDMMARQRPPGVISALLGMAARPDRSELLPGIDVPTLIISSPTDAVIPLSDSEAMQRTIPNSQLVSIPRAGHLSSLDKPEAFNAAVREFVSALP